MKKRDAHLIFLRAKELVKRGKSLYVSATKDPVDVNCEDYHCGQIRRCIIRRMRANCCASCAPTDVRGRELQPRFRVGRRAYMDEPISRMIAIEFLL